MPHRLIFHNLVAVPLWGDRPVIFWLRLYKGQRSYVAVVTEVPGNPSSSVTNCISRLAYHIEKQFAIPPGQLVLYEVWPRGTPPLGDVPTVHRVTFGERPSWEDASRAEIEAFVGTALPELPTHDELYRRVLALGGGVMQEVVRPLFEAVSVASLPPPHNPAKCQHRDLFSRLGEQHQASSSTADWFEVDLEVGRAFLDSLSPGDLRTCAFHEARWKDIAEESVRIIETLGRRDPDDYVAAADRTWLHRRDRRWLASLFADPIFIGEGRSYTNGQHRGCALRFSGAARAAVVTGDEYLGDECTDWTYKGDG